MSMTITRIFGCSKNAKYVFDKKVHVLLFGNTNIQARCKGNVTRPKVFVINKYKKSERSIGLYGYCLLSVPIITFALGTWQIKRWRWKLNLIETLQQRISTDPIDVPLDLDELKDKEYYRIKTKGRFIYEREFFMGPRSLLVNGEAFTNKDGGLFSRKSTTGYNVITPFKLEDRDLTILVNRGWIPKYARAVFKDENKITEPIEIVGVVRTSEKRPIFIPANSPRSEIWHFRDLDQMAKVAETDPVYIDLSDGYRTSGGPIGGQTKVTLRNEHFSYIITWYGLSISTAYIWFRQFVQHSPFF